jgi:signal transduction histidine kinase
MRWRLVLILVGFTTLVLLVQNIPLSTFVRDKELNARIAGLQNDAFTLAGYSVEYLERPSPVAKAALDEAVTAYSTVNGPRVIVVDAQGTAVAASVSSDIGQNFSNAERPEVTEALQGRTVSGERSSSTLGEPLIYVAVPTRVGPQILGAVRLTYPSSELNAQINSSIRSLWMAGLISLISAALIALVVSTAITRRIRRLRDTAESIADGDLNARVEDSGGGEIADLAASFNIMAERVQGLVERQRDFAGDASHQLRTPLTALRLRMDRAAELMDEDDPAVDQVDAARNEIDRLQRLVDGLLMLARADGRKSTPTPVDISAIARERIESWESLAAERAIGIDLTAPPVAVAFAVPSAAEQILDNYIDNALEVVPDGSRIVVTVTPATHYVQITVDDAGPGLSPENRVRAFDRFWRGRQDDGGSGLGLAVVSALAQASGGSVWLDESPQGGLRAGARFNR